MKHLSPVFVPVQVHSNVVLILQIAHNVLTKILNLISNYPLPCAGRHSTTSPTMGATEPLLVQIHIACFPSLLSAYPMTFSQMPNLLSDYWKVVIHLMRVLEIRYYI